MSPLGAWPVGRPVRELYNAGMTINDPILTERARRLHKDSLVFDGHADTLLDVLDAGHTIDKAPPKYHVDLERMERGGLDAEFFTAFVDPGFLPRARDRAAALVETLHAQAALFPDRLSVTTTAEAVEAARAAGRRAAVPAIEGGHAIEDSLDALRQFQARGIRLMTLTWNNSNNWADGCLPGPDDPRHGGLTDFGRRVISEMERLGVIVDISHASPETFRDVERIATKPFVASHSCAAALNPHFRNLADEQLRVLARHGGLVGVCFASAFLVDELGSWRLIKETAEYAALPEKSDHIYPDYMPAAEADLYRRRVPLATLEDVFRHVDHLVSVMGADHVALGTDFDGIKRLPVGIQDAADLPKVTEGLVARGYDDAAIRGILGGNWLRVLREVAGS